MYFVIFTGRRVLTQRLRMYLYLTRAQLQVPVASCKLRLYDLFPSGDVMLIFVYKQMQSYMVINV
jgi:hypothetical protein